MAEHHKIDYVELPATDLEEMKHFYGSAFGWQFEDYGTDYVAFTGAGLDGGFRPVEARAPMGGTMMIIYSHNIEQSEHSVKQAGGEITEWHEFPGGRRFQFIDPSGNEVAVWTKA